LSAVLHWWRVLLPSGCRPPPGRILQQRDRDNQLVRTVDSRREDRRGAELGRGVGGYVTNLGADPIGGDLWKAAGTSARRDGDYTSKWVAECGALMGSNATSAQLR